MPFENDIPEGGGEVAVKSCGNRQFLDAGPCGRAAWKR